MRTSSVFFCLAFIFFTINAKASELLPYELHYSATWNGFPVFGKAIRELKKISATDYVLNQEASALIGSFKERSEFSYQHQIIPKNYLNERRGFGRKRSNEIVFDWTNNKARDISDKEESLIDIKKSTLDRLTYQVQLRNDLIKLSTLKTNQQFHYVIAEKGKLRDYTFEIISHEVLKTDLGDFNTVKLDIVRKNKNRKTTLWLAIDWDFVPLRIIQVEKDGSTYELMIDSGSVNAKTLSGLDATLSVK